MNIVVQRYDGRVECRPDTSWEREDKDLYAPDFVSGYLYSPVLFARISKAGKCIGSKFAARYYDAVNYGVLLYASICDPFPENAVCKDGMTDTLPRKLSPANENDVPGGDTGESTGLSSVMDHTSVLPFPMYDKITLGSGKNEFRICLDAGPVSGKEENATGDRIVFNTSCGSTELIEKALCHISEFVSLRIGDIIAVELARQDILVSRKDCRKTDGNVTTTRLYGSFCGNTSFDFNIIM